MYTMTVNRGILQKQRLTGTAGVSLILAVVCLLLAITVQSTSAAAVFHDATIVAKAPSIPFARERRHEGEMHQEVGHSDVAPMVATALKMVAEEYNADHVHKEIHGTAGYQEISHHSHGHAHIHDEPHPYDGVPSPSSLGLMMIVVPPLPKGAGGHSHEHGRAAPVQELNETVLLRGKGPDPLSYIEWDFAYGLASRNGDLARFANAYPTADGSWQDLMGNSGGRYRRLVDEVDTNTRKWVIEDIQSRVKVDANNPGRHRYLMIMHVIGCIVSCFVLLPIALALRAAESTLAHSASLVYFIAFIISLVCSKVYKAMAPQLYPANNHGGLGYAIFWISFVALGGDVLRLLKQIWSGFRDSRSLSNILTGHTSGRMQSSEYNPLEEEEMLEDATSGVSNAKEEHATVAPQNARKNSVGFSSGSHSPPRSVHFEEEEEEDHHRSRSWSHDSVSPSSTLLNTPRTSLLGEVPSLAWKLSFDKAVKPADPDRFRPRTDADTLGEYSFDAKPSACFYTLRQVLRYTQVTIARSIPVISFAAAYTGLAVYTGSCRGPYQNVCMAHGIKGGIFFWYGLLSFGRYLGAYADQGWAWNKPPAESERSGRRRIPFSAEWVECLVIFIYGAINTWMERFGAASGDPYTVKQVQHISIAVMFWFAGLMGLILEIGSLRRLLAFPVSLRQASLSRGQGSQGRAGSRSTSPDEIISGHASPPSYSFSFNPFPALVIGVTGVAMAAHHQDYVYEVSIHALWGNLLAGFSVLRMLTYFFLWLRPPTNSVMPSRPPTEALASFSLTCGGLVFMLSSEEVSFVAMRNGFGDFMMVMNVTVAVVSLLFCWVAAIMVLKAWAMKREHVRATAKAERIRLDEAREWRQHGRVHGHTVRNSAFIVGDEEDEEDELRARDEKRQQMTSSPEQV